MRRARQALAEVESLLKAGIGGNDLVRDRRLLRSEVAILEGRPDPYEIPEEVREAAARRRYESLKARFGEKRAREILRRAGGG